MQKRFMDKSWFQLAYRLYCLLVDWFSADNGKRWIYLGINSHGESIFSIHAHNEYAGDFYVAYRFGSIQHIWHWSMDVCNKHTYCTISHTIYHYGVFDECWHAMTNDEKQSIIAERKAEFSWFK